MSLSRKYLLNQLADKLVLIIVIVAIFLRVWQFCANRSLWLDEAYLAVNIVKYSFFELMQKHPLDYDQRAPLGFLFTEKAFFLLLGNQDYVMRLFPLVANIISLFLMVKAANNFLTKRGVLLALALFSVSSKLIYFASELKQYSSDVMITLLLLVSIFECFKEKASLRQFMILGVSGLFSLFVSHSSLFIITGISVYCIFSYIMQRDWQKLQWFFGVLFAWLLMLVVLYFISLRFITFNKELLSFWGRRDSFMPMPPWGNLAWFSKAFLAMIIYPFDMSGIIIDVYAVFLLMGIFFVCCEKKWPMLFLLICPIFATMIASGLKKYPFFDRMLLFNVPIMFLLIAKGVEQTCFVLKKSKTAWLVDIVWVSLVTFMIYGPVILAVENFMHPYMREHIKPVISHINNNRVEGDVVYLYYAAIPAFEYYAPLYDFDDSHVVYGVYGVDGRIYSMFISDVDRLKGCEFVWFLFSHNCYWCIVNQEKYYLEYLDKIGTRLDESFAPGASAYLYDLSAQNNNLGVLDSLER